MSDVASLKGLLSTATSLIRKGDLAAAEEILRMVESAEIGSELGPRTALGMPRKLQAVRLRLAKARGDDVAKIGLQYHLVPPVDVLGPLFEVDAVERQVLVAAAGHEVPKVLHQIWIGGPPPETTEIWRTYAASVGWEYSLWGEDALADLGVYDNPVFENRIARDDLPGAVDVARYHVLVKHGGLYLDCDWVPVSTAPPEAHIPLRGLSVTAETTPRLTGTGSPFLNNSVIAAPPDHPAILRLLERLPEVIRRLPTGPAWWVTGPLAFTLACRVGPITVLDAALSTETLTGSRQEIDLEITKLREEGSSAFLAGWKPWDNA